MKRKVIPFPDPLKRDMAKMPFSEDQLREALIYKNVESRLSTDPELRHSPDFILMVTKITSAIMARKNEFATTGLETVITEEINKVAPDRQELRIRKNVERRLFGDIEE